MKNITIYSDGGTFNNGRKEKNKLSFGSFGTIVLEDGKEIHRNFKAFKEKTNNFCELAGILYGINYIIQKYPSEKMNVELVSDSQYVTKGVSEWIKNWRKNGWKNNAKQDISNKELWLLMDKYLKIKNIKIKATWVKGHSLKDDTHSQYQEKCDNMNVKYKKKILQILE